MSKPVTAPAADCDDATGLLIVAEARRRVLAEVAPVAEIEPVPLRAALGRVLAREIRSPIDVPAHTNSAMDGYALAARDLPAAGETELRVAGTAWAGRPYDAAIAPGECVRIMTGAPLPAGTDSVIMQEQVEAGNGRIRIRAGHRAGEGPAAGIAWFGSRRHTENALEESAL